MSRRDNDRPVIRRRYLLGLAAAGAVSIAGCSSGGDDTGAGNGGGSTEAGFEACSTPDGEDLRAMLPTEDDVDGLSKAGSGGGTDLGTEREKRVFREGGSTDVETVAARFEAAPETEDELSRVIQYVDSAHAEVIAYVTAEEYVFFAGGFSEEHAIEMLTSFPVVDEDCAQQAVFVDSDS